MESIIPRLIIQKVDFLASSPQNIRAKSQTQKASVELMTVDWLRLIDCLEGLQSHF